MQAQSVVSPSMHFRQNGFVQNQGQFCDQHGKVSKQVEFLYAKKDFHLALNHSGFSYELIQETMQAEAFPESGLTDPDDQEDWQNQQAIQESVSRINISLKGSNPHPEIIADHNTGTVCNYYLGKIVAVNVPSFNRVTYKNIYAGIDLVFEDHQSETGGNPEYSFIVHPGADVHQIRMMYSGAGSLQLEDQHTLAIAMPNGFIRERGLRGYWLEDGTPSEVSFHLKNGTLSFNAEDNKNKTLIIDPSIVWGTYFGGTATETYLEESEIALDKNNDVILSGSTTSSHNIATTGAVMLTYGGSRDMLLAKFSTDGQLLWATYFGGSALDVAYGIYCDSYNNIVLTGGTKSANIMTTAGVFQTTLEGVSDVVVAKFSSAGQLIWCTLMGGPNDLNPKKEFEDGRSLICDVNDNIYVCGYVQSATNIATTGSYQATYKGNGDAFLVKLNKDGQKVWGTYFSGTGQDRAHALCFDPTGHIYIVGTGKSKKSWITGGFQTHFGGIVDAFIAKFDTAGNYYWSSYYGGAAQDHGRGVSCDGAGNVYMNGWTAASENNVISTPGSFQEQYSNNLDGFIVKFTPLGHRVWGTYFGGPDMDQFFSMTIDPEANLYVEGMASSSSGIATIDGFQPEYGGGQDVMMAMFDSSGHRIWSTYFGSNTKDNSFDIERDSSGRIYITVNTHGDLPVSEDAYQTFVRGQDDLAVFKFNFTPCTDNNEPNETFATPHVITDPLSQVAINIDGAISTAADQDWFALHLRSEDTLVTLTLADPDKYYDLEVYNPNDSLIASTTSSGRFGNKLITLYYDTGTLFIKVLHDNINFSAFNCYTIQIVSSAEKISDPISTSSDRRLKIYPNPTTGLMTTELEGCQEGNISIKVFDAIGRMVFSQAGQATEGANAFSLNLSDLNAGLYYLEVKGINTRSVMKFVIEK